MAKAIKNNFGRKSYGRRKSFAELLEAAEQKPVRLKPGESVEAVIAKISTDWVFIDLGGKTEGIVEKSEFLDKEGQLTVKEGDTVKAYFLSSRHGERISRRGLRDAARQYLEEAWQNSIPVEGIVEKEIKGGLEVRIAGTYRAFCPFSQAGLGRGGTAATILGSGFPSSSSSTASGPEDHRLAQKDPREEERKRKEAIKGTLQEGMKVTAPSSLSAISAPSSISEASRPCFPSRRSAGASGRYPRALRRWPDRRGGHPQPRLGQRPHHLEREGNASGPLGKCGDEISEGSRHQGTVARLADFGAFITLEEASTASSPFPGCRRQEDPPPAGGPHPRRHDRGRGGIGGPGKAAPVSLPGGTEEEREDSYSPYLQKGARASAPWGT